MEKYITEFTEPHIESFLRKMYHEFWDEWLGQLIIELDQQGFDITHFPNDDYTRNVRNPHAIRIGRTIALEMQRMQDKIKQLEENQNER